MELHGHRSRLHCRRGAGFIAWRMTAQGGAAPANVVLGDTWEWNGEVWEQRTPTTAPAARFGYGLAYDSHRQVVVLFGGQTGPAFGQGVLGDTWEWNGTEWSQRDVAGPS